MESVVCILQSIFQHMEFTARERQSQAQHSLDFCPRGISSPSSRSSLSLTAETIPSQPPGSLVESSRKP